MAKGESYGKHGRNACIATQVLTSLAVKKMAESHGI
jgi:hypothetical protein